MQATSFKAALNLTPLLIRSHRLVNKLLQQRLELEEFATLRNLRNTIQDHGITRGLLQFANRDNLLGVVVKDLPATESLNAVPLTARDPRQRSALEGLDEALDQEGAVVGSWVQQLAIDLADLLEATTNSTDAVDAKIEAVVQQLSDATLSDVVLDTTIMTTRTATGFDAIFTAVAKRLRQVGSINVDAFFTSNEYHQANCAFIADVVDEFKPMLGVTLDEGSFVHAGNDEIDEAYQPREASLADLGYTSEALTEVLNHAVDLLHAIDELGSKKDEIVAAINEVATRLGQPTEAGSSMPVDINTAHQLLANYAAVIIMLLGDGLHHVNEFMAAAEEIVDTADEHSDDGKSD